MPTRPYIPERYEFIKGGDPLKWDEDIDTALIIGGDDEIPENPYRADPRLGGLFRGASEYDVGVSFLDDEIEGGSFDDPEDIPAETWSGSGEPRDPLDNMKEHLEKRGSYLPDNVIANEIVSQSFDGGSLELDDMAITVGGDSLDLGSLVDGGSEDEGEKDAVGFYDLIEDEIITGAGELSITDLLE